MPRVLVVDSVQTVFSSKLSSSPGTISQVREVANQVFRFAKRNQVSSFLIGHITKEGSLAGPKSLEHMVDVVLLFEGERDHSHRVLRALKNRFGPVSELAIFEMTAAGLQADRQSLGLLPQGAPGRGAPGSVVVSTIKGTRPLLVEIQALVSSTLFSGNPRRMTVGLDHFRTAMLLAVIEKKLGYQLRRARTSTSTWPAGWRSTSRPPTWASCPGGRLLPQEQGRCPPAWPSSAKSG